LGAIARKLRKLHSIKPVGLIKHNYRRRLFMDLHPKYLNHYLHLIEKYKNDNLVFSHNDLNENNIIESNNIPHFIDFEYSCANSRYWDLANLINEANLDSWQQQVFVKNYGEINEQKLYDYSFIQLFFSYTWAIDHPDKILINKYKNQLKEKLTKFNLSKLST
jgi:choline kinase